MLGIRVWVVLMTLTILANGCQNKVDIAHPLALQLISENEEQIISLNTDRTFVSMYEGQVLKLQSPGVQRSLKDAHWRLTDPTVGTVDDNGHFTAVQRGVTQVSLEIDGRVYHFSILVQPSANRNINLVNPPIKSPASLINTPLPNEEPSPRSTRVFLSDLTQAPSSQKQALVVSAPDHTFSASLLLPISGETFQTGFLLPISLNITQLPAFVEAENPDNQFELIIKNAKGEQVDTISFKGKTLITRWKSVQSAGHYTLFLRSHRVPATRFEYQLTEFQLSDIDPHAGNQAPLIESVTITPNPLSGPFSPAQLQVTASDGDGDSLYYSWTAEAGTFNEPLLQNPLWLSPEQGGAFQVTVTVSDGVAEAQRTEQIQILAGSDSIVGNVKVIF